MSDAKKSVDAREELASYIAGELSAESAAVWENRLASDPALRAEMTLLRQTWETLDFLQMPLPSPQFSARTLRLATSALPSAPDRDFCRMIGLNIEGIAVKRKRDR